MEAKYEVIKELRFLPGYLEGDTYCYSPNDLVHDIAHQPMNFPMFFDYDLDGDQFVTAVDEMTHKFALLMGHHERDRWVRIVDVINTPEGTAPGIPIRELKTDMSIVEGIKEYCKFKTDSADFPIKAELPFFMGTLIDEEVFKEIDTWQVKEDALTKLIYEMSLFNATLTHFKDGCCVSLTIQHILSDPQRYFMLLSYVAMSYREEEVPLLYSDRQYLYPDVFSQNFPHLGPDSPERRLKREIISKDNTPLTYPSYPGQTTQMHAFYFTHATLERMRHYLSPYLAADEYVSRQDMLTALLWMMECEATAKKHPVANGADLEIDNTLIYISLELIQNGYGFLFPPENEDRYTGNAFTIHPVECYRLNVDNSPLIEVLAKLSLAIRKKIKTLREKHPLIARALLDYHFACNGKDMDPPDWERNRGRSSCLVNARILKTDFGQGSPVWTHMMAYPICNRTVFMGPGPNGDGIVVFAVFFASQMERIKNSAVRKALAPEMTDVYNECSDQGVRNILGLLD